MQSQSKPYPNVSVRQLLERQLADWQHLQTELQADNAPSQQIAYCQSQIERLQAELAQLSN